MLTAIFLRHGNDNRYRRLTWHGELQIRDVAQQLIDAKIFPDAVLVSPSFRTMSSGNIVTEVYGAAGKEIGLPKPDENLCKWRIIDSLRNLTGINTVLIVSHEHHIAPAVGSLTAAARHLSNREQFLRKGNALVLRSQQPDWESAVQARDAEIWRLFEPRIFVPNVTGPAQRLAGLHAT